MRERASRELSRLHKASWALRKARKGGLPLEQRSRHRSPSGRPCRPRANAEQLHAIRALSNLEQIGGPESTEVLPQVASPAQRGHANAEVQGAGATEAGQIGGPGRVGVADSQFRYYPGEGIVKRADLRISWDIREEQHDGTGMVNVFRSANHAPTPSWLNHGSTVLVIPSACNRRVFPVLERVIFNVDGQTQLPARRLQLFERVAEGIATDERMQQLYPPDTIGMPWGDTLADSLNAADHIAFEALLNKRFCNRTAERRAAARQSARSKAFKTERTAQSELLRCMVNNPFRPASTISTDLLSWNNGSVFKLAQGIYDQRAFDRLPILADALEEAGCTNADILNHCRQPGEHVRGCWVVDLLLAKVDASRTSIRAAHGSAAE